MASLEHAVILEAIPEVSEQVGLQVEIADNLDITEKLEDLEIKTGSAEELEI